MVTQKYTLIHLSFDLGFSSVDELLGFAKKAKTMYATRFMLKDKAHPEKGKRMINPPQKQLKNKLRKLLEKVLYPLETPNNMGGGKGSSTKQIMKKHVGKDMLLCYDIKDFFPSIKRKMIYCRLRDYGFVKDVASTITDLVTFKNHLPQGSPCSTQLAKLIIIPPAKHLYRLLHNYGPSVTVSFWVDDIIISGPKSLKNIESECYQNVHEIFQRYGLQLKRDKIKVMPKTEEQEALGLRVDRHCVEPNSAFRISYSEEVKQNGYLSKKALGMRKYIQQIKQG